ncbi:hypothetical protein HanIR_Chr02g0097821 [Helianthus annuus]|nr:hypothetical protein HanIR_Chr02g0097821 [Helianthus annuus]
MEMGTDLKCICIYCIYRCERVGDACFLSSCGPSPTSRRGRPGRSRGVRRCLAWRRTRTNRGRSPYRTALNSNKDNKMEPFISRIYYSKLQMNSSYNTTIKLVYQNSLQLIFFIHILFFKSQPLIDYPSPDQEFENHPPPSPPLPVAINRISSHFSKIHDKDSKFMPQIVP